MSEVSAGGIAGWSGAAFELRLGAEFCAYMLAGEFAGLLPGAIAMVQPQAPEVVDDLVVEFESGSRWAIQAKAGRLQVSWKAPSPFAKALLQLFDGAKKGQIDVSIESSDRLELAIEEDKAASSVRSFGSWLDKARRHSSWQGFAASCTSKEEKGFLEGLTGLLEIQADDKLLHILKKIHLRKIRSDDEQGQALRSLLIRSGIVEPSSAESLLEVLLSVVRKAAPNRGQIRYEDLVNAANEEKISVNGILSSVSFRVLEDPSEESLVKSLELSPVHPRFVDRPELEGVSEQEGVLVMGKKGSGKSRALTCLVQHKVPAVIILRGFREEDVGRLLHRTEILKRRIHGLYQMVWDDIQVKPKLFADLAEKLRERKDDVRILCACRSEQLDKVTEQLGEGFWNRQRITGKVILQDLDASQSLQITDAVSEALDLEMDEAARDALAGHIQKGDAGPLFAVSTGQLILENTGRKIRAADIKGLPEELLETWKLLYRSLEGRPHVQSLLHVLRLLYEIQCPPEERICRLLYTKLLERSKEDFRQAIQALDGLWIGRAGGMLASHDVSMEAVPEEAARFQEMVDFARRAEEDDASMGILQGSISTFYQNMIPYTHHKEERKGLSELSTALGVKSVDSLRKVSNVANLATSLVIASNALAEGMALETTREARAGMLQRAIGYIEEAIEIYRALGLQANVATSLNNASNRYSDLAGLETTREARAEKLQRAIDYIEEAIEIYRALGLQADVAMSLNNASSFYSDLAGLETTREARAEMLERAIAYIEEAIEIYRALGLQADVAMSLNNASLRYSDLAGLETSGEARAEKLQRAIAYIEEAIEIYRALGLQADVAMSLNNASLRYSDLAGLETTREARAKKLQRAIAYIEEAIEIYRALGLQANVATSLNNASNRYSDLAGLETGGEAMAEKLQRAIAYIEEAIEIYRALGLQADVAMSLNNASSFYSDLAGLETTREARAEKLQRAIDYIEEAIEIYRALGLQANVATSLNNASNRYSDLAGLETSGEARAEKLQRAIAYIEEAIEIYRALGLQANVATSLNNASLRYSDLAGLETSGEARAEKLQRAIAYIEEAIEIYRALGLQANVATSLNNASLRYSDLAGLETSGEARAEKLQRAIAYIEEAIKIRRALGLQADVAMSLNNASSFYSDLAGLETTREAMAEKLQRAIAYIEEAIKIRRALGLQADVAMSLNNASSFYSDLAGLETTREAMAEKLQRAIAYIEEAIKIRRALGLQADIAMSLGTANICYRNMAEVEESPYHPAELMKRALECIEEAVGIFRGLGLAAYQSRSLANAVITHLAMAEFAEVDPDRVRALCMEGLAVAEKMEDDDLIGFFQQVIALLRG